MVLVHGQPTWGYLWRRVVAPLMEDGLRCVELLEAASLSMRTGAVVDVQHVELG